MIGLGTQDTLGEAEEFLDKYGTKSFTMLWDESFESWTALNVSSQPTAILFAADGHPIQAWRGPLPESRFWRSLSHRAEAVRSGREWRGSRTGFHRHDHHVRPADITVLHVRNCPSVAPLLERLLVAADLAGVSISTTLRVVESEPEASEIGFAGSPTVLIDGTDPIPSDGVTSFGCRLYDVGGRLDGAPSMAQLTAAL